MPLESRVEVVRVADGIEIVRSTNVGPPPPPYVLGHWAFGMLREGESTVRNDGHTVRYAPESVCVGAPGSLIVVVRRHTPFTRSIVVNVWPEVVERLLGDRVTAPSALEPGAATVLRRAVQKLQLGRPLADEGLGDLLGLLRRGARESERPTLGPVLEALEEAPAEPHSLEDLAKLAGTSKFMLIRSFRTELGTTPHAYLTAIRVARARDLLRAGVSVKQAATKVGFCDSSHLGRHFKRVVGVSPSAYSSVTTGHHRSSLDR